MVSIIAIKHLKLFHINLVCRQTRGYRFCYLMLIILCQYFIHSFICTQCFQVQTFLFLTIQFSISHLFEQSLNSRSIWLIDRVLSGATTPGQSESGSNSYEWVLHFPQLSKAGDSPSDCLMPYPGHLLVGVLLLWKDAVSVFNSHNQLGSTDLDHFTASKRFAISDRNYR